MAVITVTKLVRVHVSQKEVTKFRKENPSCTHLGPLSVDENIEKVIADTKATELIYSRDRLVETTTSLDEETDLDFEK